MSVSGDEYARRADVDRLDRAVDRLREQLLGVERRQADNREADTRAHLAEHRLLEERMEREREAHEAEHEREHEGAMARLRGLEERKDRSWTKLITLGAALAGAVSAWVAILSYLHAH